MTCYRPLVTILEGLGVSKENFIYLLKNEIEEVYNSHKSTNNLVKILRKHSFGTSFRFTTLLSRLSNKYGLDIDTENPMRCIRTDFINNIISCYTNFIFRGFKYRCRIPVPNSWTLVGIADEGPAYISQKRYKACDVFTLRKGQIYGMINLINIYFKNLLLITSQLVYKIARIRNVYISKDFVIYLGALLSTREMVNTLQFYFVLLLIFTFLVRRVYAIGRPPNNMICAFKNQVNVVVLPSRGMF